MDKIFYLIGKSATGKDSFLEALLKDETLHLKKIVQYTTRPRRGGEEEGREYHFISDEVARAMEEAGKIVEMRAYDTVHGIWKYMLADDGSLQEDGSWIAAGTVESYVKVRDYFGAGRVMPLYIYVETGERLSRALKRERDHAFPKYKEMCRRFLADEEDFSDEKLKAAGLMNEDGSYVSGFENDDFEKCLKALSEAVRKNGKDCKEMTKADTASAESDGYGS